MISAPHFAAIDLGSNNCRLLIARPENSSFRVVDSFSRIVRLGEGVGTSGRLCEPAIGRSIEALNECAVRIRKRATVGFRAVTTEACRQASNFLDFAKRVETETGLHLEVISAREEAELAIAGCAELFDPLHDGVLVFDIGGGSTELSIVDLCDDGYFIRKCLSAPCGVVRFAEQFGGDNIDNACFAAMVGEAERVFLALMQRESNDSLSGKRLMALGTSGTVTTLAGVHLSLERYARHRVDGLWLDYAHVPHMVERLRAMSLAERANIPSVGPERADLVLAGAAILTAIHNLWPFDRLRVADRGVREGILLNLMRENAFAREN